MSSATGVPLWKIISFLISVSYYQIEYYWTKYKFRMMAVPVMMYDSENWSLNRSDKRKIEAAEIIFLRPMAEYTRKEVAI